MLCSSRWANSRVAHRLIDAGLPPYCLPTYPLSARPQSRYAGLQDFIWQLDTTQLDAEGLEAASDAAAAAAEAAELTSSALGGLSADLSTLFSDPMVPSGLSPQLSTSAIAHTAAGLPMPAGPFAAPQLPGSAPGHSGDFAAASGQTALAASQHDVALLLQEVQRTQQVRPPDAGVPLPLASVASSEQLARLSMLLALA